MSERGRRGSIFLEEAMVLSHEAHAAGQYLLSLRAPLCAREARPGSFVHLRCDPLLPMRRPLSIMRVDRKNGRVELLYKMVGEGTRLLASRHPGEQISLLGPIGQPFEAHSDRSLPLLIGGGVGIPPIVFLAETLRADRHFRPFAIFGSEVPFPFHARPSQHLVPGLPPEVIAAMPLLDDWGIPSRLTSFLGLPGCFGGYATDLARIWLEGLDAGALAQVEIFACGPHPMLAATAALARELDLPCQVSLEELMACAVGGCAGCAVETRAGDGISMKRVCVDGPVFDAYSIFPD